MRGNRGGSSTNSVGKIIICKHVKNMYENVVSMSVFVVSLFLTSTKTCFFKFLWFLVFWGFVVIDFLF